jgi:hypothetical protein
MQGHVGKTGALPCNTRTILNDRRSDAYRRGIRVLPMIQTTVVRKGDRGFADIAECEISKG